MPHDLLAMRTMHLAVQPRIVHCAHVLFRMTCCLHLQVGQEGYMRSRARRWARVVDDATWPEVLRRYLLATRAMLPQPSPQELAGDVSCIDDDAAAVMAATLLAERSFLRCACTACVSLGDCSFCAS